MSWIAPERRIGIDIVDNRDGEENAPRIDNLLIVMVDHYECKENEEFDVDKWGSSCSYLLCPATRANWKLAYAIARTLSKHGVAFIRDMGIKIESPCRLCWGEESRRNIVTVNYNKTFDVLAPRLP